jgi:hypothetical protein
LKKRRVIKGIEMDVRENNHREAAVSGGSTAAPAGQTDTYRQKKNYTAGKL